MKSKLTADNLPIYELALYWAPEIGWPVALLERQLHHFALDGARNSFGVILRGFRGPSPAPAPVHLNHEQRVHWAKTVERAGVFREPVISALVDGHAKTLARLLGRNVTREDLIDSYVARPLWGLSKSAALEFCRQEKLHAPSFWPMPRAAGPGARPRSIVAEIVAFVSARPKDTEKAHKAAAKAQLKFSDDEWREAFGQVVGDVKMRRGETTRRV